MTRTVQEIADWYRHYTGRTLEAPIRPYPVNGFNASAGASSEHVWPGGGILSNPGATEQALEVVSSSANDDSGGTGIETARIELLDSQFVENFVDITMDGTTIVTSGLEPAALRTNRAFGLTWGSLGRAGGDIDWRLRTTGTPIYEQIPSGYRSSQSGRFTVPDQWVALIWGWHIGMEAGESAILELLHNYDAQASPPALLTNPAPAPTATRGGDDGAYPFPDPIYVPQHTDVETMCSRVGADDVDVGVTLDVTLIRATWQA